MFLVPDLDTFAPIPWEPGIGPDGKEKLHTGSARVICDVFTPNGDPFPGDPRWRPPPPARAAKAKGFVLNTGPGARVLPAAPVERERRAAAARRGRLLRPLRGPRHRGPQGDDELARGVRDQGRDGAPRGRHRAARDRLRVRRCAPHRRQRGHLQDDPQGGRRNSKGLYATFMPKPFFGINGSGMHTHQSLWDVKKAKNAFSDPKDSTACPRRAPVHRRHARARARHDRRPRAAGEQLQAPRARLRGAGLRRLGAHQPLGAHPHPADQQGLSSNSVRIELRCPDPSSNPYLAFAAMLAAGLDGIERKLAPPDPVEENLYRRCRTLPHERSTAVSFHETTHARHGSAYARSLPGSTITAPAASGFLSNPVCARVASIIRTAAASTRKVGRTR
jgi:glutamine synthetase